MLYIVLFIFILMLIVIISTAVTLVITNPWTNDNISLGNEIMVGIFIYIFSTFSTYKTIVFTTQHLTFNGKWTLAVRIFWTFVTMSAIFGLLLLLIKVPTFHLFSIHFLSYSLISILVGMTYSFEKVPFVELIGIAVSISSLIIIYHLLHRKFNKGVDE